MSNEQYGGPKSVLIYTVGLHIAHWPRFMAILLLLLFGLAAGASAGSFPARTNSAVPNIGIEGRVSVDLPSAVYRPRPLDDRTELILRIESLRPLTNGQCRYEFYYMGLEPGAYRLADFLIRPDGSRPEELGDQTIQVRSMLPEDHDGQLNAHVARLFPFIGGYRAFLVSLGVLWVGGIGAFIYCSRRKPVAAPTAVLAPPLSLAERMRPLVEAAAAGQLSADGQAQLERLLMGYWREKLALPEVRMAAALARLKGHAEAGALLRALEQWLHRPGGVSAREVGALLRPYRHIPAPPQAVTAGGAA